MDFCVPSFLETKACSVAHTSVEALKRSLVWEWAKMPQEHYRAAVDEFQRRLDMVIHVKGGHIEKWGYRLILIYISYYTVFFVIYAYFDLLTKQKKGQWLFVTLYLNIQLLTANSFDATSVTKSVKAPLTDSATSAIIVSWVLISPTAASFMWASKHAGECWLRAMQWRESACWLTCNEDSSTCMAKVRSNCLMS